jgi:hypothetical protein
MYRPLRITQAAILSLAVVSFSSMEVCAQFWKKGDKEIDKEKITDKKEEKPPEHKGDTKEASPAGAAAGGMACCGLGLLPLIGIFIGIMCYFVPSVVAYMRGHPNLASIVVVNFFLGWTLVGFVIALAWSFTAIEEKPGFATRRRRTRDDDDD